MRFFNALIGGKALDHVEIAKACEAAGFDGVALSDHVFHPETLESKYPYTDDGTPMFSPDEEWPDVWVSVGGMAAATTTLRFITNVYILPLRNPFVVAKAVGTAAYLSGDRVELGVGAGWMREEFDQMEQPFRARGKRLDESIEVIRKLWSGGMVEHHGDHYDFAPLSMNPTPERQVPFLIGGHSDIALRRAARNDGWIGVNYTIEELEGYLQRLDEFRRGGRHRRSPLRGGGFAAAGAHAREHRTPRGHGRHHAADVGMVLGGRILGGPCPCTGVHRAVRRPVHPAAAVTEHTDDTRAADGRVPGRRGLATRQRLLDCTLKLLQDASYRDLKVVDIAREAGTSPGTFYQYFPDVTEAIVALSEDMAAAGNVSLTTLVREGPWDADHGYETALAIADAFIEFWEAHWPLMRVMELSARRGRPTVPQHPDSVAS